jgi:hypothetical protein
VIQDIAADWAIGGPETIARVRRTDPTAYFRVVASILPKDVLVNVQQGPGWKPMSLTWPQEAGAASSMRLAAALAGSRFLEPVTPGTFRSPAP